MSFDRLLLAQNYDYQSQLSSDFDYPVNRGRDAKKEKRNLPEITE